MCVSARASLMGAVNLYFIRDLSIPVNNFDYLLLLKTVKT